MTLLETRHVVGGGHGTIYAASFEGDLLWFKDGRQDGTISWAPRSGGRIGSGWHGMRHVVPAGGGVIYGVNQVGELRWFRDDSDDGTPGWAATSGQHVLGTGWEGMCHVVAGGGGTIYAVNDLGELRWFGDRSDGGPMRWALGSGNVIGTGWHGMRHVIAGGGGVLYGVTETGELRWFRDLKDNGEIGWAAASGNQIGTGWHNMRHVVSGRGGVLYAVNEDGDILYFRDGRNDGVSGWAPGTGNRIGTGWQYLTWLPPLAALGHRSLTVRGRPARGRRHLLVVLVEYSGAAAAFPPFSTIPGDPHSREYYRDLAFGSPQPPFFTAPGPAGGTATNPASLSGYIRENSHGRFDLVPAGAGVVGPVRMGPFATLPGLPEQRTSLVLQQLSQNGTVRFGLRDLDDDGRVDIDELVVLFVENIVGALPATRTCNPFTVTEPFGTGTQTKVVQVNVAGVGSRTDFYTIAHEVCHCLGLDARSDLRGYGEQNGQLTVMSQQPGNWVDNQRSVHLDGFHKHVLGWVDARVHRLTTPGSATIASHATSPDAPVVLWDPNRGDQEYLLLESRGATGAGRLPYDEAVAVAEPEANQRGLAIWRAPAGTLSRVTEHLGAPDLRGAGRTMWSTDQLTPTLRWVDGSSTGARLRIGAMDPAAGTVDVSWTSRHFPRSIYAIGEDGMLRWYRHNGYLTGGGAETWEPQDTGHKVVGTGFGDVRIAFGAGRGVIYTIAQDGVLRWYKHNGYVEGGGIETWEPQDTGHKVVGTGFDDVRIAVPAGSGVIYTISQDGKLRWYRHRGYLTGGGLETWDPQDTGHKVVGTGFDEVRIAFAGGLGVLYTISTDGQLRWYRHVGYLTGGGIETWEPQDTGHKVVGTGFDRVRLAFPGGHGVIYTVSDDGVLRWYRHLGYRTGGSRETWEPQDTGHRVVGHGWQGIILAFAMLT